jgi:anti-sigma regulatory factor (Ser/Thr protein kinase)
MISAFNEAFNNVVEHGYGASKRGDVEVTVRVEPTQLILEIVDQGRSFDFDASGATSPPPVTDLDAGGMGLFIIRRAVTRVTYERNANDNRLTLTQSLSACDASSDAGDGATNDEGSQC